MADTYTPTHEQIALSLLHPTEYAYPHSTDTYYGITAEQIQTLLEQITNGQAHCTFGRDVQYTPSDDQKAQIKHLLELLVQLQSINMMNTAGLLIAGIKELQQQVQQLQLFVHGDFANPTINEKPLLPDRVAEDQILHVGINALVQALSKEIFKTSNPIEPETAEESRLNTFSRVDRLDAAVNGKALLEWDEKEGAPPRIKLHKEAGTLYTENQQPFDGIHDTLNHLMRIIGNMVNNKNISEVLTMYTANDITDLNDFCNKMVALYGAEGTTYNEGIPDETAFDDAVNKKENAVALIQFIWNKVKATNDNISRLKSRIVAQHSFDGTVQTDTILTLQELPNHITLANFNHLLCVIGEKETVTLIGYTAGGSVADNVAEAVKFAGTVVLDMSSVAGETEEAGSHIHSINGSTKNAGDHEHTVSGSTQGESSHTHNITISDANTGIHTHALNVTKDMNGDNVTNVSIVDNAGEHTHSNVNSPTDAGSSHSHAIPIITSQTTGDHAHSVEITSTEEEDHKHDIIFHDHTINKYKITIQKTSNDDQWVIKLTDNVLQEYFINQQVTIIGVI